MPTLLRRQEPKLAYLTELNKLPKGSPADISWAELEQLSVARLAALRESAHLGAIAVTVTSSSPSSWVDWRAADASIVKVEVVTVDGWYQVAVARQEASRSILVDGGSFWGSRSQISADATLELSPWDVTDPAVSVSAARGPLAGVHIAADGAVKVVFPSGQHFVELADPILEALYDLNR